MVRKMLPATVLLLALAGDVHPEDAELVADDGTSRRARATKAA